MSGRFRPGPAHDLLRPEPHSTTGRAIASLALRRLNDDFGALSADRFRGERARAAFSAFRDEMDGLLPGRPKERVAVLASPFVRAPLELALETGGEAEAIDASCRGLFALQLGAGLGRAREVAGASSAVWSFDPPARGALGEDARFPLAERSIEPLEVTRVGELVLSAAAGDAFGMEATAGAEEERAALENALALIDAAAPGAALDLVRFFPLVVPIERGVDPRPGVLGLGLPGPALDVALRMLEALALTKMSLYCRALGVDASPWVPAAACAVRRAFILDLERVRHPLARAPASIARLAEEEGRLSRLARVEGDEPSIEGLLGEISRLLERSPGDAKRHRTP